MTETATTLPAPLRYEEAVVLARAVVIDFGADHVDLLSVDEDVCAYVNDGKPSCIVAQILHRHGVPVTELSKWEGLNGSDMGPSGVRTATGYVLERQPTSRLVADHRTAQFLGHLQDLQDGGATWGDALEHALSLDSIHAANL